MSILRYPGPLWKLRALLVHLIVVVSVIIWGLVCLLILLLRFPTGVLTRAGVGWLDFVCWLHGIRFEIDRSESDFDPARPTLIVSNHQSLWDIPAAMKAFRGANVRMVAKKELFAIPIFGTVLRYGDFISVDRGNQTSSKAATQAIGDRLRRGIHVWVAPEGTRSEGAHLLPFKKGAFAVAIEAQIPVQPIVVVDSYKAMPKSSWFPRAGSVVHVKILKPVPTTGLGTSDRAGLAQKVFDQMKDVLVKAPK